MTTYPSFKIHTKEEDFRGYRLHILQLAAYTGGLGIKKSLDQLAVLIIAYLTDCDRPATRLRGMCQSFGWFRHIGGGAHGCTMPPHWRRRTRVHGAPTLAEAHTGARCPHIGGGAHGCTVPPHWRRRTRVHGAPTLAEAHTGARCPHIGGGAHGCTVPPHWRRRTRVHGAPTLAEAHTGARCPHIGGGAHTGIPRDKLRFGAFGVTTKNIPLGIRLQIRGKNGNDNITERVP